MIFLVETQLNKTDSLVCDSRNSVDGIHGRRKEIIYGNDVSFTQEGLFINGFLEDGEHIEYYENGEVHKNTQREI